MLSDAQLNTIDSHLIHRINRIAIALARHFDAVLERLKTGINTDEWTLLFHVVKYQGQSQAWYGKSILRNKTATMRIVDRLEGMKLVKRVCESHDRRQKLLFPSQKGSELIQETVPLLREHLDQLTGHIEPADIETCSSVLAAMDTALDTYWLSSNK